MTIVTRVRRSSETLSGRFSTRDTVAVETPAIDATCRNPTRPFSRLDLSFIPRTLFTVVPQPAAPPTCKPVPG
jgi:hypothetical protein